MASHTYASLGATSPAAFGAWLRHVRVSKGIIQRTLAAAADMDSSHLGKVERGERLPTAAQVVAMARMLGVAEQAALAQLMAAKMWQECDGDAALAHSTAALVQDAAAPYLSIPPVNNRAKKK
jgi:transcriptional regulator with XRE-family HTH domain